MKTNADKQNSCQDILNQDTLREVHTALEACNLVDKNFISWTEISRRDRSSKPLQKKKVLLLCVLLTSAMPP